MFPVVGYCGCQSGSGTGFPLCRPWYNLTPSFSHVGKCWKIRNFFTFFTFIRNHSLIIYNTIMDIIFWLKKKKGYGSGWAGAGADPDQHPPKLCRSDRIRIRNTGNLYKCPDLWLLKIYFAFFIWETDKGKIISCIKTFVLAGPLATASMDAIREAPSAFCVNTVTGYRTLESKL